ncbi:MAG TPA: MaoC family dehydratase N-terminal domain-containing protein [Rhizomicrobium sp.]|nr:MaoC family dehydratase N-terminal domain-containing protein [Rhizomicrobium sp.]
MDIDRLRGWIGGTEAADDIAAAAPLAGLAALLDHDTPPWPKDEVPPLGHWLYFLPRARQSEIDVDGHPRRGGFLPPIDLPRRMFAGATITFHAPIAIGAKIERVSTILDVTEKRGASGRLVFVKLRHEISANGTLALSEEQDIVYREAAIPAKAGTQEKEASPQSPRPAEQTRRIVPDATQLFRFSALTFNAHRIHYDRDYARNVEFYPALVVQGPYIATLLMDHLLRHDPAMRLHAFRFRAKSPLFDTAPFDVCFARKESGYDLRAIDTHGREAMTAEAIQTP